MDSPIPALAPTPSKTEKATIEEHAEARKTPAWLFHSTKAYHRWAVGQEVSGADYEAAVEAAANCKTGSLKNEDGSDTSGMLTRSK